MLVDEEAYFGGFFGVSFLERDSQIFTRELNLQLVGTCVSKHK